ncbi:MAG TPA: IS4 family transposase [Opitutaceae bacterium]
MSVYRAASTLKDRFPLVLSSFLQGEGLPFSDILSAERIDQVFDEAGASFAEDEENAVYTPAVTLWAFLSQVLFKGKQRSCLAAVSRVMVFLVALGQKACSKNTGAYCRARAKLPTAAIRQLTTEGAASAETRLADECLWQGRHVKLVDGFTLSMPDTPENQAEYPQPPAQQPGIGFPLARCVVLLSLATAMTADLEIGPYSGKETGETALLRKLLARLESGDILLADCYYCSYFMICLLKELGVDFIVRQHQCRATDFRRGERLGPGDHIVTWARPPQPKWMDNDTYAQMPESIAVREVEVRVSQPGFRVASFVVVTTLIEAETYPAEDIGDLFRKRWLAELDIRALKSTLGMDVLRCQTPEMVRKEIWTALLAYNLIRQAMLQAALQAGLSPRDLSFAHALQTIAASWMSMALLSPARQEALIAAALKGLRRPLVGRRPDRIEPRAIKRRPKPHDLLTRPRAEARDELLKSRA